MLPKRFGNEASGTHRPFQDRGNGRGHCTYALSRGEPFDLGLQKEHIVFTVWLLRTPPALKIMNAGPDPPERPAEMPSPTEDVPSAELLNPSLSGSLVADYE